MIEFLAYLAIMAGCVLGGCVVMAIVAQGGRNEPEARYRAMLFQVWWQDSVRVVNPVTMSFDEWLIGLSIEVDKNQGRSS